MMDTYPYTIATITVASYEDDGAQYTLVLPDGETRTIGNAETLYHDLAARIDGEDTEPYVLHYVSQDIDERGGALTTWSVYTEHYANRHDDEPIEGTSRRVATVPDEAAAEHVAHYLQTRIDGEA